jgi:putative transcriptional regulator
MSEESAPQQRQSDGAATPTINLTNHFLIAMPGMEDDLFGKSVVYLCEHNENGALGLMINKPSDFSIKHLFDKVELPLGRAELADMPVFHGGPVQTEHGFVLHDAMSDGLQGGLGVRRVPLRRVRAHDAEAGAERAQQGDAAAAAEAALAGTGSAPQDAALRSVAAGVAAVATAASDAAAAAVPDAAPDASPAIRISVDEPAAGDREETTESAYASTLRIPGGGLEMTTSRDVLEAVASGAGPRRLLVSLGYAAWAQGQLESELAENNWLTVNADAAVIFDTPVEQRYSRALSLLGIREFMLSQQAGHA